MLGLDTCAARSAGVTIQTIPRIVIRGEQIG
jgi:hypothetical protein